jgi:hypothetical protein
VRATRSAAAAKLPYSATAIKVLKKRMLLMGGPVVVGVAAS